MSPRLVKKALHRRLAYLEVSIGRDMLPERLQELFEQEAGALRLVLGRLDILDAELLARFKAAVTTLVLPRQDKKRADVRRAFEIAREHGSGVDLERIAEELHEPVEAVA